jgi:hypothetical protein
MHVVEEYYLLVYNAVQSVESQEDRTLDNHRSENIQSYIVFLYEATHRRFGKLRIKKPDSQ